MSIDEQRQKVREFFNFCCGYGGVSETDVGALLTLDHFHPRSKGGSDSLDNLVYCCHACNEFKGNYWQPELERRILHPKQDVMTVNLFTEENGRLIALTPTGEFHLKRLRLNREALIAYRQKQERIAQDNAGRKALLEAVSQLEERVETLKALVTILVPKPENNDPPH